MSALEDRIAASSKVVITRNAMTAMVRNGSEMVQVLPTAERGHFKPKIANASDDQQTCFIMVQSGQRLLGHVRSEV